MPGPTAIPPKLRAAPFTTASAKAAGVSLDVLRGSRFRQLRRGVYVVAEIPDSVELRVDAARLVLPTEVVFSHQTAALLRGVPVTDDGLVHVRIPSGWPRARLSGVRIHEGGGGWAHSRGRRVSTPADVFVELAEELDLVGLVIAGDALARRWVGLDRLRAATASSNRRRGLVVARRAIGLVRERVDSPMETRLRLLLVLAGLPCPEPGRAIYGDPSQWIATVDLQYPELKIALEYDGDHHRTSRRQWQHDVAARDELRRHGWIVLSITADDVFRHPERTVDRVAEALASRGCRPAA